MNILIYFAKRFVAGENLEDAIKATRILNKNDIKTTLDFLGEHTLIKKEVSKNIEQYKKLIRSINILKLNSNISLKLSSLGIDISKKYCLKNLSYLVKYASKYKVAVTIDMEGSKYTTTTINFYKKLHKKYPNLEIAIQANLKRSYKDILSLIKRKANIRLVKGAYKESSKISYLKKEDTNKNYIYLLIKLIKSKGFIAIATHDQKIIEKAKNYFKKYNVKKYRYEFQMLYGIRRNLQIELADKSFPIRVYVPYGKKWLPYFYRRLRERKENILFIVKNLMRG